MMKTNLGRTVLFLSVALATGAALGLIPAEALAEKPSLSNDSSASATSGPFTGSLTGVITIGTRAVLINDQTTIYRPGRGTIKRSTFVVDNSVYATGDIRDGVLVARIVIVFEGVANNDMRPLTSANLKVRESDKSQ